MFLLAPITAHSYILAPDTISSDTVWYPDNQYVIASDLTIQEGAKLTIAPGAVVAFANESAIWAEGGLEIGGDGARTTIGSAFYLSDTYPDMLDFSGESEISIVVGSLEISNTDMVAPVNIISSGGRTDIRGSAINGGYFALKDGSEMSITDARLESFDEAILLGGSRMSFEHVALDGAYTRGSLFYIFQGSRFDLTDSDIAPIFADFALLNQSSQLNATSTTIRDVSRYGIQANGNSAVTLHKVSFDSIIEPYFAAAFLVLVGSDGLVSRSTFKDTTMHAIDVYSSQSRPSVLSMSDSVIDGHQAGIQAVRSIVDIKGSVIKNGTIGADIISSTSTISRSAIYGNSDYGVSLYPSSYSLDAKNNFWGDASGPFEPDANPGGKGDRITSNVSFVPWLLAEPEKCCSSVVFLPGLEASRLYSGTKRLWEPGLEGVSGLHMDENGESSDPSVIAGGIIDEAYASVRGPNIYKGFIDYMDDMAASGSIDGWSALPYDWRLAPERILASSDILRQIEITASSSLTGKVTLVAHSNGGLLAKYIMDKLSLSGREGVVDKMILVGVPQIGTPAALGALLHGIGQGIPFVLSAKEAAAMALNMPSTYNLLPSDRYFRVIFDPVIKFRDRIGSDISKKDGLRGFLSQNKLNEYLLEKSSVAHDFLDGWEPPPDTDVIQIAGFGVDTLSGIEYFKSRKRGLPVLLYKPLLALEGDGTVLVPSALYMSTSSPKVRRYWLDLGRYNSALEKIRELRLLNRKHADIFEVEGLREVIGKLIRNEKPLDRYVSTSSPVARGDKRLRFILYAPSMKIDAYDSKGNKTGISPSTSTPMKAEESIPDSYFGAYGDVAAITLPRDGDAVRVIISVAVPSLFAAEDAFTFEIEEVSGNEAVSSISFTDVPVDHADASFEVNISGPIVPELEMKADTNGDGEIDRFIYPDSESRQGIINIDQSSMNTSQIQIGGRSGSRRKTTIRDIQELIEEVRYPELAHFSPSTSTRGEERLEAESMPAAVFYTEKTMKEALLSIWSVIVKLFKKVF